MLNLALSQFCANIKSITEHIAFQTNSNDIVVDINTNALTSVSDKEKLQLLKRNISKERIYNYNANIISLYGFFEHFIESLIEEYVESLINQIKRFDDNHTNIKNNFFSRWEKLHGKLGYPKYSHLTENQLIQLLYDSKINNKNNLIPEYYYQNGGNYKHSVICECFNYLGIDISHEMKAYDPLHSYFVSKGIMDQTEEGILYDMLNDLVARRNDVAHGNSSSILDLSYFKEYVYFLELYAKTINALLNDRLYELKWNGGSNPTISIKHLYRNSIVEIEVENFVIEVGDMVIVKEPNGNYPKYSTREVISINKNRTDMKEFITYDKDTVALGLSTNIKKKCTLKVLC